MHVAECVQVAAERLSGARATDGLNIVTPASAGLDGQNLDAVVPCGHIIVVASKSSNGGIFRSTDTGETFTRLSGTTASRAPTRSC